MATNWKRRRVLLSALTATTCLWPAVARAEIIKFEDMSRGTTVTAAQCAMHSDRVWVTAYGHGICMRYFLSEAGGSGKQATIYLEGDRHVGPRVRPEDGKDIDTDDLERHARAMSRYMGQPAIFLGRMGVEGSSGNHAQRHTKLELDITNAAIESIKERHGYADFNLYGQSGGAILVGALLAIRTDINCAVPGSGVLLTGATWINKNKITPNPAFHIMNPYDGIPKIVQRSSAKIMVVTDVRDKVVPRKYQDPFVQALQRAGRQVEQFYVNASDPKHHGVTRYAQAVTRECVRGSTHDQIARVLADVEQKIYSSKWIADRTPERRPPPAAAPTPTQPRPALPSVPAVVRDARPQEPRPSPRQAQPTAPAGPQRECKAYFPLIGINVTVPCA